MPRFRSLQIVFMFLVFLSGASSAPDPTAMHAVLRANLLGTTCRPDGNEVIVNLRVALTLNNVAERSVIVGRNPRVTTIDVARDERDLVANKLEYETSPDDIFAPVGPETSVQINDELGQKPSLHDFVVVEPNGRYETTANTPALFLMRRSVDRRPTLLKGSHRIRLWVSYWPFSWIAASEATTRWSKVGWVLTKSVLTNPIEIGIDSNGNPETCPK